METVLLPQGRTMNQEEVEVLMNQVVRRVSDTLSVSEDIAQHLLIHYKWNVDVLIQRYIEDPELLLFSSGLQVRNLQPPASPVTHCPVCVNQLSSADNPPVLCCMHYCCKVRIGSLPTLVATVSVLLVSVSPNTKVCYLCFELSTSLLSVYPSFTRFL